MEVCKEVFNAKNEVLSKYDLSSNKGSRKENAKLGDWKRWEASYCGEVPERAPGMCVAVQEGCFGIVKKNKIKWNILKSDHQKQLNVQCEEFCLFPLVDLERI